eukprot:3764868-Karenia_brevis.AAC.1
MVKKTPAFKFYYDAGIDEPDAWDEHEWGPTTFIVYECLDDQGKAQGEGLMQIDRRFHKTKDEAFVRGTNI